MNGRHLLAAVTALAVVLPGCTRDVGTVILVFVTSPIVDERPLPEDTSVESIELRVEGPGIGVRRQTERYVGPETEILVPGVDVGPDRIFTVTARNAVGEDQARARSLPHDIQEDDETLFMYLALVGRSSEATTRMTSPRFRHTATVLPDGRVLLAGGGTEKVVGAEDGEADFFVRDSFVVPAAPLGYAEIFDPTSASVVTDPQACVAGLPLCLYCARMGHAAGVDIEGAPLLAWGEPACRHNTADRFVPQGRSTATRSGFELGPILGPSLAESASFATPGGMVVAGGLDLVDGTASSRAVIVSGSGATVLGLQRARYAAAGAPLPDGGGIVLGGFISSPPLGTPPNCGLCVDEPPDNLCSRTDCRTRGRTETDVTGSIERFDPAAETFEELGRGLVVPRAYATATALPDGRVVVVGGLGNIGGLGSQKYPVTSIEVFDPDRGESCEVGQLNVGRWMHAAFATDDGRVMVTGGYQGDFGVVSDAILVLPIGSGCSPVQPAPLLIGLSLRRAGHTATPLGNGAVLLAGGVAGDGSVTDTLEMLWLE